LLKGGGQQLMLLEAALDHVAINPDLTKQVLDIRVSEDTKIVVRRYVL
jgi:hypothetical protein